MRWRLDQLEALVWISRLGSFRAAAKRLNVSQPAVSGRIRELERQTGAKLIDRSQLRPRITRRGAEIIRYAEQIIRIGEHLTAHLKSKEALVGTIRMGVADSFAVTHLAPLLERFAKLHPAASVELDVGFSANLERKLRAAELDVAFLHAPVPGPDLAIEPLLEYELAWFASPRLNLSKAILRPADLADIPVLSNPEPSHLYGTIMDWFGTAGLAAHRINTCSSLSIITKLAVDGFGVALLPVALVEAELRNHALRRLRTKPELPPSRLTVAYRKHSEIGDLAIVVQLARELVQAREAT